MVGRYHFGSYSTSGLVCQNIHSTRINAPLKAHQPISVKFVQHNNISIIWISLKGWMVSAKCINRLGRHAEDHDNEPGKVYSITHRTQRRRRRMGWEAIIWSSAACHHHRLHQYITIIINDNRHHYGCSNETRAGLWIGSIPVLTCSLCDSDAFNMGPVNLEDSIDGAQTQDWYLRLIFTLSEIFGASVWKG